MGPEHKRQQSCYLKINAKDLVPKYHDQDGSLEVHYWIYMEVTPSLGHEMLKATVGRLARWQSH